MNAKVTKFELTQTNSALSAQNAFLGTQLADALAELNAARATIEALRSELSIAASLIFDMREQTEAPKSSAPDAYCVTTPDGDCVSTDPRCMHQSAAPISARRAEMNAARAEAMRTGKSVLVTPTLKTKTWTPAPPSEASLAYRAKCAAARELAMRTGKSVVV